jgi:hypothetical protein
VLQRRRQRQQLLQSPSSRRVLQRKRQRQQLLPSPSSRRVLQKEKGNDNKCCHRLLIWLCYKEEGCVVFFSMFEKKKKRTTTSITFFDGFVVKKGNDSCHHLFQWFCYEEGDGNNVVAFSYGGGVVEKTMATSGFLFSFFLFLFFWS